MSEEQASCGSLWRGHRDLGTICGPAARPLSRCRKWMQSVQRIRKSGRQGMRSFCRQFNGTVWEENLSVTLHLFSPAPELATQSIR
jgi:hypothetical protein